LIPYATGHLATDESNEILIPEAVSATSGVSVSVRPVSRPKTSRCLRFFCSFCQAFEQFKEAINDEDFEDLLKDAQADPKGGVAQDLLKKLLPFLNISGWQVPWGNAERNAEVTKLMAEHRWYGPGSHFVNLAPGNVHNPSAVRLCHPFVGYDQAPAQVGDDDPRSPIPPLSTLTYLTRNTRAPHFTPQHWLLCHMGLY